MVHSWKQEQIAVPSPDVKSLPSQVTTPDVQLGLRANWQQFTLLVIIKIDLVGPARRGLAMGINEAAGYGAVSLAAIAAGYLAATYALRPQPFLLGVVFALAGLLLSIFFVRESQGHARHEAALLARQSNHAPQTAQQATDQAAQGHTALSFKEIFLLTSWKDRRLFAVSQAGLVNNLNDGLAWGLLPLFFAAGGLS